MYNAKREDLKMLWSTALFCLGLVVTGNWHDEVLRHYAVRCTMPPDPSPFPVQLVRLSNGHFTTKGVRELLVCESEPLFAVRKRPANRH